LELDEDEDASSWSWSTYPEDEDEDASSWGKRHPPTYLWSTWEGWWHLLPCPWRDGICRWWIILCTVEIIVCG